VIALGNPGDENAADPETPKPKNQPKNRQEFRADRDVLNRNDWMEAQDERGVRMTKALEKQQQARRDELIGMGAPAEKTAQTTKETQNLFTSNRRYVSRKLDQDPSSKKQQGVLNVNGKDLIVEGKHMQMGIKSGNGKVTRVGKSNKHLFVNGKHIGHHKTPKASFNYQFKKPKPPKWRIQQNQDNLQAWKQNGMKGSPTAPPPPPKPSRKRARSDSASGRATKSKNN
jgi:hypothetical protein